MPPAFVFAIALKPKSASSDWQQVENNLRRTIRSARASDPAASVIVACHDEPELGEVADGVVAPPRPVPRAGEPGRGRAGTRQLSVATPAAWLRETMRDDDAVYVMFLDADDLGASRPRRPRVLEA